VNEDDPRQALARRLRELREAHWPGTKVTQLQLAAALGGNGKKSVSVPLISSWESRTSPKPPPAGRLEDYATFFATPRSLDGPAAHLLRPEELTEGELAVRQELLEELTALRDAAQGGPRTGAATITGLRAIAQSLNTGPYRFPEDQDVTIVCAQLPQDLLDRMMPYTNPQDPDFIELYRYSELGSLFELYGHLRATNPIAQVNLRLAGELRYDDYAAHLILLGGVDWNVATRSVLDRLQLPVRQINDWGKPEGAYFEVQDSDGGKTAHRPLLEGSADRPILREDVALFARAANPFNRKRSLTICNGMYGSGSLGAVRALTDARFRDRNADYIKERFADGDTYCILIRVIVEAGETLTPDWTLPETRLFEWSRP
jgi:transcriptional regulator with XRE-family HTH domain